MNPDEFKALKKAVPLATVITLGLSLILGNRPSSYSRLENTVNENTPATSPAGSLVIKDPLYQEAKEIVIPYESFPYRRELEGILLHSERLNVPAELIMAIRMAENGSEGIEYGILPSGIEQKARYAEDKGYEFPNGKFRTYVNEGEKQLAWAARTVQRNQERFNLDSKGHNDFISYLASVYAPHNVSNDPLNLNKNWEKNVRFYYEKLRGQKSK